VPRVTILVVLLSPQSNRFFPAPPLRVLWWTKTLGQVLFRVIRLCPFSIFPRLLHNLIYHDTAVTGRTWVWRLWVFK